MESDIPKKAAITLFITSFLAIIFSFGIMSSYKTKKGCSSFSSQKEAQAHYSRSLDRDNDGVACEKLK